MTLTLKSSTRNFCKYCRNELVNEEEIKIQAHKHCLNDITFFEHENDIIKNFNEPDAKFLVELYSLLAIPYIISDFSGRIPPIRIGFILHSHQKPTIEIEAINKQVISIQISGTFLNTIPDSIKNVKSLKRLWLSNNRFTEVPRALCFLPNLEELLLDGNLISSVPKKIQNLTKLKKLDLAGNNDIPLCLEVDENTLFRRGNKIKELPDEIGNLSRLETLNLRRNDLTYLPANIDRLLSLKYLIVSSNRITGLPESFTKLKSLRQLDLSYNQFTSYPNVIIDLPSLSELDVSWNPLPDLPKDFHTKFHSKKDFKFHFYGKSIMKS